MTTRLVMAELVKSFKELFESQLAVEFLSQPALFISMKKVSDAIIDLINRNYTVVLKQVTDNSKIKEELFGKQFFGQFDQERKKNAEPESILKTMLAILKKNERLDQVMQIHSVFIHRIYDQIRQDKKGWVDTIFSDQLFGKSHRGRVESKDLPLTHTTLKLGITRHPVLEKRVSAGGYPHARALGRFELDAKSTFHEKIKGKNVPFVAGVSGHTGSLLLGAKLYGNLSATELAEYAFVCFVFLAAGGNHSFHEVMMVAKQVGVPYELNQYAEHIPQSVKESDAYRKLSREFPQFAGHAHELPLIEQTIQDETTNLVWELREFFEENAEPARITKQYLR